MKLKEELRAIRETFPESHAVRLHRAISWLQAADKYKEDDDIAFITLWVAFNSCYSIDGVTASLTERQSFKQFIEQLVSLDSENYLQNCLWNNYSGFVKAVVNNQYLYPPFWESQRNGDNAWIASFETSKKTAMFSLANSDVPQLMQVVLDRLYVLRNQLMHGGATYQSSVNRDQVKDGRRLLSEVLPVIIELMMNHPEVDWGDIFYPVVKE